MNSAMMTKQVLNEVGIPISTFSRRLGISSQTLTRWFSGGLKISSGLQDRIQKYISILTKANEEMKKIEMR
ncbi:MAG: hypothetical protein K6G90_14585 [Clostridia bacterium]|nr:hypothetical protein [Clostridia bacterium]